MSTNPAPTSDKPLLVEVYREGSHWVAHIQSTTYDGTPRGTNVAEVTLAVLDEIERTDGQPRAVSFVFPSTARIATARDKRNQAQALLDQAAASEQDAAAELLAAGVTLADITRLTGLTQSQIAAVRDSGRPPPNPGPAVRGAIRSGPAAVMDKSDG